MINSTKKKISILIANANKVSLGYGIIDHFAACKEEQPFGLGSKIWLDWSGSASIRFDQYVSLPRWCYLTLVLFAVRFLLLIQ